MALKDIGHTVGDLGRVGLLIAKKKIVQNLADERNVTPGMVSELVDRIHPDRMKAEVVEILKETETTKTFRLKPVDGPFPPFRAGQFLNLFLDVDGVATSRPYSISSPPNRTGTLDITLRRMPQGFVSQYLCDRASVGDVFDLSGPAGCFFHEPLIDTGKLVFLAGGCGITPFMSMIRQAADTKPELEMHLIYGNRVPDDVIFKNRLAELGDSLESLRVDVVISEPPEGYEGHMGFLDSKMIRNLVSEVEGRTFFICGPHAMYDLCVAALGEIGVPARRIKRELSGPLPDITRVKGWPKKLSPDKKFTVTVEGMDKPFEAKSSEPLLNSLERSGVVVDCLCRSGECGVCRIRLLQGEVFMPETTSLRKTDAVFGYIHTCTAYPVSDITVRL